MGIVGSVLVRRNEVMTTRRYRKEIGRFEAASDSGERYTIVEYQTMIETQLISGRKSVVGGTKELLLANGDDVNFIDDDTFKIVKDNKIIRRVR